MRTSAPLIFVAAALACICLVSGPNARRTRAAAAVDAPAAAPATRPAEPVIVWGEASDGLRLGLAVEPPAADGRHPIVVAFRNDGPSDVLLNVGAMLGNGSRQLPTAVRLRLARPDGRADDLELAFPGVAGRMDDMPVPLPAGGVYRLRVVLETYATANAAARLGPGENRLTARFDGAGPQTDNTGMEGMRTMKFWRGRLDAGPVRVDGPAQ